MKITLLAHEKNNTYPGFRIGANGIQSQFKFLQMSLQQFESKFGGIMHAGSASVESNGFKFRLLNRTIIYGNSCFSDPIVWVSERNAAHSARLPDDYEACQNLFHNGDLLVL